MSSYLPLEQLLDLIKICEVVAESKTSWETKYDIIFSQSVSLKIYNLVRVCDFKFDYRDPDTSYEEDVMYFVNALRDMRSKYVA